MLPTLVTSLFITVSLVALTRAAPNCITNPVTAKAGRAYNVAGPFYLSCEEHGNCIWTGLPANAGKVRITRLNFPAGQPGRVQLKQDGEVAADCHAVQGNQLSYYWYRTFPGEAGQCNMEIPGGFDGFTIGCYW